ncbi:MAG: hypothetical protein U0N77_02950 [Turicibacter sanguinis]|uniref:hypothetical protein n=1 Tax=Turicibacter sanguinis TaxID=154288 RepID=UPI002F92C13A
MENQKVTTIEGRGVCEVETILEDMILKMKQQFDGLLNVPQVSQEVELSKEIRKLIECLATVRRTSGNLLEVGAVEIDDDSLLGFFNEIKESETENGFKKDMCIEELKDSHLTTESTQRSHMLSEKLLKCCRQGYSTNEIKGALHEVKGVLDNLPVK